MWIAFLLACETLKSPVASDVEVVSLSVEPATASLATSPDASASTAFIARATLDDGSEVVLDGAEWTLSNQSVGTVEDGVVQSSTENGGISYVTARFAGQEARALLTVTWSDARVESGPGPDAFAAAGATQPIDNLWAYPEDNVNLPRNTPSIQFQWNDASAEGYRLRFRGPTTDLSIFTASTSWTASEDLWQIIAATNAGGSLEIDLAALAGGVVYETAPRTVNVNRFDGRGSIYYWSVSAMGIMEVPWGEPAREFLTVNQTGGRCVGCHDISSNGMLAVSLDGGDGPNTLRNVRDGTVVNGGDGAIVGNFKTFSPDGSFLLTAFQGALLLYDGQTGAYLGEVPVDGQATHVDWSPDGSQVVAVVVDGAYTTDWVFTGGRVVVMDHVGDGSFAAPRTIYTAPAGMNAYYPTFSPDSAWIAFNLSSEDAYDDGSAELWAMDREGGHALSLHEANLTPGVTNSWPRWGPLPDDSVMWLSFSSRRNYGNITAGNPQIWVTAFDPDAALRGEDPSWPAFWLPGQDPSQGNHIPVWAE